MADDMRAKPERTPPASGRQDHYAMRADAMRPITGPASTDALAAGGGLVLPRGTRANLPLETEAPARELIPGERDSTTLTHRERGAFGGGFAGDHTPPSTQAWLSPEIAHEYELDGGGSERERHHGTGQKHTRHVEKQGLR